MLDELVTDLLGTPDVADLLATSPFGDAAIYTRWAPEHARPYITIMSDEAPAGSVMRAGNVDFDIWGDGAAHTELEPIRDALVEHLDHLVLDTDRGPVRFFYGTDGPEQDPDPKIVRWRVTFAFRRARVTFPNQ